MKEHYKHLLTSQFEQDAIKDIDRMLSEELAKPEHSRNYNKIDELTDAYSHLVGTDEEIDKAAELGITALKEKMHNMHKPHVTRKLRVMITIACAALVLLVANTITVVAWDMNLLSLIINISQGGFSVEFPERDAVILPTSVDDPYGIKTECAKYGLEVEAPTYLPEGFVLDKVENNSIEGVIKDVRFLYHREKQGLTISYSYFYDGNSSWLIPSDKYNLSETLINGKKAVISKEDHQFTIIWADKNLESVIYTYDLDYSECDKIIESIN